MGEVTSRKYNPAWVLKRSRNVMFRKDNDGHYALFTLDNRDRFFIIDGIASEFWSMIDGKKSVSEIMNQIVKSHNVISELRQFESVASQFVTDIVDEKLVEVMSKNLKNRHEQFVSE